MSKNFNGPQGYGSPEASSYNFQQNKQSARNIEQKSAKSFDKTQGKEDFRIPEGAGGAVETFNQYNQAMKALSPFERGVANTFFKAGVSPEQARERLSKSRISEAGRSRIEFTLLLAFAILVFLAACGVPMTALPETLSPPTVAAPLTVEAPTMAADESTPVAVTEAATETPDFDGSYFTYDAEVEQHQTEAESILEKNWALIYDKIIKPGIAVNFEVTCITASNFCIEPTDGYPQGTYFTLSNVPGFEGQVITTTTGKASEVAGVPVVEITLGNTGNPVGLDASGKVVVWVNGKGAWQKGEIPLATDLVDDRETEGEPAAELTIEQINENAGDVVRITKTFKGVDYNIYWSPNRNQWRSDHNTPPEELDLTGDSFPELVVGPDAVSLEKINLPVLGEKTLIELYQMSEDDLKKYTIQLIQDAMRAEFPDISPQKLQQMEFDIISSNMLPVVIDASNPQTKLYVESRNRPENPKLTIPEAGVTFHEGRPTNVVLMPILNSNGDVLCYVHIHQTAIISSGVTEFSSSGKLTTGGYAFNDIHAFGNTPGDSFAILTFGNTPNQAEGSLLEGEEGIGDLNTIKKLKNAHTLEEVNEILQGIRIIVVEDLQAVVER